MSRPTLIRTDQFPYHITARSNNKELFKIPMERLWEIFGKYLNCIAEKYKVEIHTFVLMSNHFHLILSTPLQNVDRVTRYFLTQLSKTIGYESGRINRIFGGRHKRTLLNYDYALPYVYKYVYRNPVRAGLCKRPELYPYSTLFHLLRGSCSIPIIEGYDSIWGEIPKFPNERLEWLNIPTPKEQEELIARALRRKEFRFTSDKKCQCLLKKLRKNYGIEV